MVRGMERSEGHQRQAKRDPYLICWLLAIQLPLALEPTRAADPVESAVVVARPPCSPHRPGAQGLARALLTAAGPASFPACESQPVLVTPEARP